MSVRKMRLISEALFKQLFDKDKEKSDILLDQKQHVLQRKDIPDDIKSQLYHSTVRNLVSSLKEAENRPLPTLVKEKTSAYDTELGNKTKILDTWLAMNNFVEKDNGTFTIGGVSQGNTQLKSLKKHILGTVPANSKVPQGYTEAEKAMGNRGMTSDYFKVKAQKGSGMKPKRNDSKTKMLMMKKKMKTTKKNFKQVMWKPY